ncbi:hypothetical protein LCGC14_2176800 [marine sediment metagenome]|uniref:Uncharacterized protein n=1 Tax=marine sediment metagenome TaxID=412755 RepID=A0A0F9DNG1_9ZZZZ
MRKRVIIFAVAIAFMASPAMDAKAAVVFDTTAETNTGFLQIGRTGITEKTAQSFTTVGAVSSGNLTYDGTFNESGVGGADSTFTMEIWSDDGSDLPNALLFSANETFDTTDIAGFGPTDLQFTFSGVTLLDATQYHLVMDDPAPDGEDDDFRIKRTDTDFYAGQTMAQFNGTVWAIGNVNIRFFGVLDQNVTTPNEITVPFDGETITAVPFQIQGTCDQAEEPILRVEISHADLGIMELRSVSCFGDVWAAPEMGTFLFNDDFVVTLSADNFVELPFDTHDFTVNEVGNPIPPPPQAAVQCAGATNLFLEGLCDILVFLLVPNTQTLQRVEGLFDTLAVKPPLGFLTVALAAFDDLEQGSSAEELEGTSDLSVYFDPIKTAISALLWLLFAVFLIRRVSTITI